MQTVSRSGGGPVEFRHLIPAGSSSAIFIRRSDGSSSTFYATSDHLGSADLVLDAGGGVLARESFGPFGARRGSNWQGVPTTADYTTFSNTTRQGFTGHEMLDAVGLVHMNGRVYDPTLGRFLSADTVIQTLGSSQAINPYAYAWNDPLKYLDPSGHSLLGDIVGIIVAIVAIYFMQSELFYGYGSLSVSTAFVAGFAGGFVGAYISTGSLSAALTAGLIAGISAAAFAEIGEYAGQLARAGSEWAKPYAVLAHAAVGCVSTAANGGNCGKGALAAGLSEVANQAGFIEAPGKSLATWGTARGVAEAGLVGGVASRIVGGSFNEGFTVSGAGYLFNSAVHSNGKLLSGEMTVRCNGLTDGQCGAAIARLNDTNVSFPDGTGVQVKYRQYNSSIWDMFSDPDITVQGQPFFGQKNGEFEGGNVLYVDPSRIDTNTVGHELGHFLGLGHNPSVDSVMYEYSVPERLNHFDYQDVQELLRKYGASP